MNTIICPRCHQQNAATQAFCASCGQPLAQNNFGNQVQNNFGNQAPNQYAGAQPNYNQMPARKKGMGVGKILLIVGGSLALIGIIAAAVIGLAVTQTLIYKIQGKWKMTDAAVAGTSLNMGTLSGTIIEFGWDGKCKTTLPTGATETNTYEIVDNKQLKIWNPKNSTWQVFDTSVSGKTMTTTMVKNNASISLNYVRVE